MTTRPRCMALNKAGDQCANRAATNNDYCGIHRATPNTGRPTKLTPTLIDQLATEVERGAFYDDACLAAGISRQTLYRWRTEGEAAIENGQDTLQASFVTRLARATAVAHQAAANSILHHRFNDWRAAAWYLERRDPARWGPKQTVTHEGGVSVGKPRTVAPATSEQRDAILALLEQSRALEVGEALTDE